MDESPVRLLHHHQWSGIRAFRVVTSVVLFKGLSPGAKTVLNMPTVVFEYEAFVEK